MDFLKNTLRLASPIQLVLLKLKNRAVALKSSYRGLLASVIVLLLLFSNSAVGAETQPIGYFKSGVCGLTVEDAHISTYFLKNGKGRQVKINAFSKCGVPQQSVSFVLEIWKVGLLGDHKVRTFRQTILNPINPRKVDFLISRVKCLNYLPTIYYGRGQAKAIIQGKEFVSPWVVSEHQNILDCGT